MAAPKKYSDELRERATRLALESGRPIAHIAQDLGVHKEALRTWVRQAKADAAGGSPTVLSSAEREELKRLGGEGRALREGGRRAGGAGGWGGRGGGGGGGGRGGGGGGKGDHDRLPASVVSRSAFGSC